MKIIDENGRIFGKINVIDFVAILLIVMIIPTAYYGYKVAKLRKLKPSANARLQNKPQEWIEVEVELQGAPSVLANVISEGDVYKNDEGVEAARITEIIDVKPSKISMVAPDNSIVIGEDPYKKDVKLKIDFLCTRDRGRYVFKNKDVRINDPIVFDTDTYAFEALVIGVKPKQ